MDKVQKIIFYYDDRCGFCTLGAKWLRRADYRDKMEFLPLAQNRHILPQNDTETAWLFHSGQWYRDSEAVIRGLMAVGFPFSLSAIFLLIPRSLRDSVYKFIARIRYLILGHRHPVCERETNT
ncbi:MAG: thiol-disulfide oxidoreductase DCC family protein [Bacteroidales bacterium]